MSKAWSLRYALARAQLGLEETITHLTTSTASLPDAISKGLEVYRKELTKVILFTGAVSSFRPPCWPLRLEDTVVWLHSL